MSTSNRATLINKIQKVLTKNYKPYNPPTDRSLLDHLLYASCLENSSPDAADEAFAKLQEMFFDWNEVRVTTVVELSQVMSSLQDPVESAQRIRKSLQGVFEEHYTFDIDFLKKQNLGKSVKELEKLNALSPFVLSYFTQHGLGGHSIPLNAGALHAMYVVGAITEKEWKQSRVPGLERAIPKTKGADVASLFHQLGVQFNKSPFAPAIRNLLIEIAPDAKERLPKKGGRKATPTKKSQKAAPKRTESKKTPPAEEPTKKSAPKKKTVKKKVAAKKTPAKTPPKKAATQKTADKKKPAKKSTTKKLAKKKPR